jgi:hypothetical protein
MESEEDFADPSELAVFVELAEFAGGIPALT